MEASLDLCHALCLEHFADLGQFNLKNSKCQHRSSETPGSNPTVAQQDTTNYVNDAELASDRAFALETQNEAENHEN